MVNNPETGGCQEDKQHNFIKRVGSVIKYLCTTTNSQEKEQDVPDLANEIIEVDFEKKRKIL